MQQHDLVPDWQGSLERFSEFLARAGLPAQLIWVFREDFYSPSFRTHYARYPVPPENSRLAEAYFESVRRKSFGVQLRAQFSIEHSSAVTVWAPGDALSAEYAMVSGLKLSAAQPLVPAIPVRSRFLWRLRTLSPAYRFNQRQSFDVPLRAELATLAV